MNKVIRTELDRIKAESFTDPITASDVDAMGLLISHCFQWDGNMILRACANALEDANFHAECAAVTKMADTLETE